MIILNGKKYNNEEIQNLINESTSISQILNKIGIASKGGNHTRLSNYIKNGNFDTTTLVGRHIKNSSNKGVSKRKLSEVLTIGSTGNSSKLKNRLISEGIKEYKCEKCGNTMYDGEIIPLELHHVNGDHYDNRLENLLLLCPICHYRTSNFRGRHIQYDKSLSEIAKVNSTGKIDLLLEKEQLEDKILRLKKIERGEIPTGSAKTKILKTCKCCGKEYRGHGDYFCSIDCYNKFYNVKVYTKEDIIEKSKTCHSLVELGRMYGITDNGIKKHLKKLGIINEVKKNFLKNITN